MTCIIGVEAPDGTVYMGADSAATTGWSIEAVAWPKIFRHNGFLIGTTGHARAAQILQYRLEVCPQRNEESDERHIYLLVEAIRDCLKAQGYATVEDKKEEQDSNFLVGYRGHLYRITSNYSIIRSRDEFMAVGCGRQYAMGAIAALCELQPRERILASLEISARFNAAVAGPFVVLDDRGGVAK